MIKKTFLIKFFAQWLVNILKFEKQSCDQDIIDEKNLLQSVANSESLTNLKIIIAKCDKKLLQSVSGITESGRIYYKVRQLLQSVKGGYYKL